MCLPWDSKKNATLQKLSLNLLLQNIPVNAISELCAHVIQHSAERWFWLQVIIFWFTWSRYWVTSLGKSLRYCFRQKRKKNSMTWANNYPCQVLKFNQFRPRRYSSDSWDWQVAGARPKQSGHTFHQPRGSGQVSYNPYEHLERKAVPFPITATTFVMW